MPKFVLNFANGGYPIPLRSGYETRIKYFMRWVPRLDAEAFAERWWIQGKWSHYTKAVLIPVLNNLKKEGKLRGLRGEELKNYISRRIKQTSGSAANFKPEYPA